MLLVEETHRHRKQGFLSGDIHTGHFLPVTFSVAVRNRLNCHGCLSAETVTFTSYVPLSSVRTEVISKLQSLFVKFPTNHVRLDKAWSDTVVMVPEVWELLYNRIVFPLLQKLFPKGLKFHTMAVALTVPELSIWLTWQGITTQDFSQATRELGTMLIGFSSQWKPEIGKPLWFTNIYVLHVNDVQ